MILSQMMQCEGVKAGGGRLNQTLVQINNRTVWKQPTVALASQSFCLEPIFYPWWFSKENAEMLHLFYFLHPPEILLSDLQ